MTTEQFDCWLAGFFDGEGCVHLPKRGVEISVANTDRTVIEMIQTRTGIGTITVVTYDRPEWKTKYHWRVRNLPQAQTLLRRLLPFLAIKRAVAELALARCDAWGAKRAALATRNAEIVSLAQAGMTQRDISAYFGLDAKGRTVSYILRGIIRDGSHPLKAPDITLHRNAHESKAKKSVGLVVRTRSTLMRA